MTPTICSGKKRQARSDLRQNIRRTHLNQALSDIVNYGCRRSANRISGSLRSGGHLEERRNMGGFPTPTNGTSFKEQNYRQLLVDVSDNAATSTSNRLDGNQPEALNSIRSKLSSGYSSNDTSYDTNSNTDTSLPSSSLREHRMYAHYSSENDDDADDDDIYAGFDSVGENDERRSRNTAKYEMDCETDSMTSLDTEKSAKLKRCNNPQLRDKLLTKLKYNNKKPLSNIRNTEGLLSIAIKTIKLVKRNQLLQQRLSQLQLETSEFIQSVLANPENKHFRENIQQTGREVENV